ncbi:MAG: tetratricopeptide repeat protein, partial [Bryobacterales bacterium]|nr:tetratricopeptide repeat protein [Bryobacterales bacterium]
MGKIVTFYSYKGGTGRSMVLANVAWILASKGNRVLAIDWDLEAPGLHRYFRPFLADRDLSDSPGLIDFVIDYVEKVLTPGSPVQEKDATWTVPYADLQNYSYALRDWQFPQGGTLDFVPAGRQSSDYSRNVNSFDWEDFYDTLGGYSFLDLVRLRLKDAYDYVLIDSRTGVSDTSGICTIQMPDTLVLCLTLNNQAIDGTARIGRSVLAARRLRNQPVRLIAVPMRVRRTEIELLQRRERHARVELEELLGDKASEWPEVEVPEVDYYAFEEVLATFRDVTGKADTVLAASERLASLVADEEGTRFAGPSDEQRQQVLDAFRDGTSVAPVHHCQFFVSYARADSQWADWIAQELERLGYSTFLDRHSIRPGANLADQIESALAGADYTIALISPAYAVAESAQRELRVALSRGPSWLIPITIDPTPPSGMLRILESIQRLDLSAADDVAARKLLQRAVSGLSLVPRQSPVEIPTESAAFPAHRIFDVPMRPVQYFVGRNEEQAAIRRILTRTDSAPSRGSVRCALVGLGGVGKTSLALQYAVAFRSDYRQVFWVDCRDAELGFARIHDLLRPDIADFDNADKAAWTRNELEKPGRPETLLILDNAQDERSVEDWVPRRENCHTLITSRFAAWSSTVQQLSVDGLDPDASQKLLLSRLDKATAEDRHAAQVLANRLGNLPLALVLAAAYVAEQPGLRLADYLRLYEQHEAELLKSSSVRLTQTLLVTIDKLSLGARAIHQMHSCFAPVPFPVDIYVKGAAFVEAETARVSQIVSETQIGSAMPGELRVRGWIADLIRYSLFQRLEGGLVRAHTLVQAVQLDALGDGALETLENVTRMFLSATPEPTSESRVQWDALLPHACALRINTHNLLGPGNVELILRIAEVQFMHGQYKEAFLEQQEGVQLLETRLGAEHPLTLGSMDRLGEILRYQGNYSEAERLHRRVLAVGERALGPDDPRVLTSMNNLVQLLIAQGRYEEAEPLCRRLVATQEQVHGAEHPDILTSVNSLGELLQRQGRYSQAEPLYRRALEARERVLGAEHPSTLGSVNNMAGLLESKGDYGAAEPLFRRALEARVRVLGAEHPDTLGSVNNLAGLLESKGDYGAAEPLFRRALEVSERVLGTEHPDTLGSVNNLASLLEKKGDYGAAEPLFRRALEVSERVLGTEHPDTLGSVNNLAVLLARKGDYGTADPLYRLALEASERVLGAEHPGTLLSVNNLASLLESKGDYGAAEPLYRRALAARERVLGAEHPDTLVSVNNLALLLESKGDYGAAEPLYRRALAA